MSRLPINTCCSVFFTLLLQCYLLLSATSLQAQPFMTRNGSGTTATAVTDNTSKVSQLSLEAELAPVPIDGQAWRLTEQAFDSFNKGQFSQAADQASLALLLRPDIARLWLLRIYATQNLGLIREALTIVEQANKHGIRNSDLYRAQEELSLALSTGRTPRYTGSIGTADSISHIQMLTPLALVKRKQETFDPYWQLVDDAYLSFNEKRYADAAALATSAIARQPNDLSVRLLLVYALQKQGKIQLANAEIQEALHRGLDSQELRQAQRSLMPPAIERTPSGAPMTAAYKKGFTLASQAFADFKKGDFSQAVNAAQQAFALDPTQQDWVFLWLDALDAQSKFKQADDVIEQALALNVTYHDALIARRQILVRRQADHYAQAGYTAIQEKKPGEAAELARQAIDLLPHTPGYWLLLIEALRLDHKPQAALAMTTDAIDQNPGDTAQFLMQRGFLNQTLGNKEQAVADFQAARATGKAPATAILDLAYSQASTGQKLAAVESFKTAIDLADQNSLTLTPEQRMNTRNSITNLSREWGGYLSAGYRGARPASTAIGGAAITVPGDAVFSTAELFWRPASFLNSSTQTFEVYGRMSNTVYDGGSQTSSQNVADPCGNGVINVSDQSNKGVSGLPTSLGALGIRLTPSTEMGLTIGLERQFMLGSATRTGYVIPESNVARCALNTKNQNGQYQTGAGNGGWMTYLTYGLYEGTELRIGKPDWFTLEAYAQTGYSWQDMPTQLTLNDNSSGQALQSDSGRLKRNQAFAAGEFRIGRSFRIDAVSDHLVLFPYLVIGGDWLSTKNQVTGLNLSGIDSVEMQGNGSTWSMGVGPGINFRYWFREDHYKGPQSYLNTTIQYRFNVGGGQADRAKGLFINMTLSY